MFKTILMSIRHERARSLNMMEKIFVEFIDLYIIYCICIVRKTCLYSLQFTRVHLQVFFKEIIFSMLESNSSSFEHKWIVINTMEKICEDPQSIVDIYVNYDCDLTATNIFERLIDGLFRVAQVVLFCVSQLLIRYMIRTYCSQVPAVRFIFVGPSNFILIISLCRLSENDVDNSARMANLL